MNVTVAICTRNRSSSLARTLDSLARMGVPHDLAWEIVVVNNGSSDDTDAVIASYEGRLPIRREFEPLPGLSNARNRAVASARGTYIVWTDDDVIVDPAWLAAYVTAFRRWPTAVLFGGRILPQLEEPVPAWLREIYPIVASAFALRDFGGQPSPLTLEGRRIPFGPNFAVRAQEQRAHPFNTELGHALGRPTIRGEETALVELILRSGKTGYWVPEATVRHVISRQQQSLHFLSEFYMGLGRNNAYRDRDSTSPRLFGVPRWLWRKAAKSASQYYLHRLTFRPRVWIEYYAGYMVDRGALEYWRTLSSN